MADTAIRETPAEPRIPDAKAQPPDPGSPFNLETAVKKASDSPPKADAPGKPDAAGKQGKAEPSESDKQIKALRDELAAVKANLDEARESERFWSARARGGNAPTEEVVEDDEDDKDSPKPAESPFSGEKTDRFLDDLGVYGLEALVKRGVLTQDQFLEKIEQLEKRLGDKVDKRLEVQRKHTATDAELAKFPDLKDPKSELFKSAQAIFLQMVADDPAMKNSPAALLSAARIARKEIDMEKQLADAKRADRQNNRRERIESQPGERSPVGEDDDVGEALSPQAREVVRNLSQFLDPKDKNPTKAEEVYRAHAIRNGRDI